MIQEITAKDLKPVLMAGVKAEVKYPFYLIKDGEQVIFAVSSGKNGLEFNKTIGFFSTFLGMQTYQCLYGQGIIVMQRNDQMGEAKEFKIVTLNPGRQVFLPAGWGMCLVNTGSSFLVVIEATNFDDKFKDEKPILEKMGFAYYIVEKKGEINFQENPNYSVHPQITTE